MKNQITLLLLLALCFACGKANAQFVNVTPSNVGLPTGTDYVFDPSSVPTPTYNRLGHLQSGTYGDAWSEWAAIGIPNFANGPVGPNKNNYYGFTANSTSDRAFFGLRNEGYNQANTILAFGDNFDSTPVPNRLIFEFDAYTNTKDREVATMLANGNVGIGDSVPTCLLHVNCTNPVPSTPSNVRFANLQSGSGNILTIDNNGYVLNSGVPVATRISNSCSTLNMLPKTAAATGDLTCSQIYDDGISVGIGTSTSFGYIWSGGLMGATPPPAAGTLALDVNGVARALAFMATSDERFKTGVETVTDPFRIINSLSGKTYYWNDMARKQEHADNGKQYGFIAQEVAKVFPEAAAIDQSGHYGLYYNAFIPVLLEGEKILYQNAVAQNEKLQSQIDELKAKVDALTKGTTGTSDSKTGTPNGNVLYQNAPNPFHTETVISYYIAKMSRNAGIMISDMNGKQLSKYSVTAVGTGSVTVKVADMAPGVYLYTLIVDGVVSDSKRMVVDSE